MFGKSNQSNGKFQPAAQPHVSAEELSKILGGGLVQVIVTETYPVQFAIFLNNKQISDIDVESLSMDIAVPQDASDCVTVRATLATYVTNVAGERVLQNRELFPCTIELIAMDRRVAVTCTRADSTDGLWVNVGLRPDGNSAELSGLREFRLLLNHDLLDARVTYVDGDSENLLPQ